MANDVRSKASLWSAIGGAGSFKNFGMTEISWGLGTAFGRPLAAQALFGMTEIPVLMEKCIACEQLLCMFARRELIGKLMGM